METRDFEWKHVISLNLILKRKPFNDNFLRIFGNKIHIHTELIVAMSKMVRVNFIYFFLLTSGVLKSVIYISFQTLYQGVLSLWIVLLIKIRLTPVNFIFIASKPF